MLILSQEPGKLKLPNSEVMSFFDRLCRFGFLLPKFRIHASKSLIKVAKQIGASQAFVCDKQYGLLYGMLIGGLNG